MSTILEICQLFMMKCGILIIGSLFWDNEGRRKKWRRQRLYIGDSIPVHAPIYYGRKSGTRGGTYTMTFQQSGPAGRAALVPCQREIQTIEDLKDEAEALWEAEDAQSDPGMIGKGWGVVGALFGNDETTAALAQAWENCFQGYGAQRLSVVRDDDVVGNNGVLKIKWPEVEDGAPADMDIMLATVTKPKPPEPSGAEEVAEAWIHQSAGHERYFFENVRHGIRTSDDGEIWRRIEERAPTWLKCKEYAKAIGILRDEVANHQ